ncbi:polyprenyl diphosphate synthase [Phosphitispora sp. TUW77]|uniref:polyprenyl diphosphate synthase n=1 Tax=Phosphitispora sp. TUW77 TaxID=3152361 RepID=UPI003AB4F707
MIGLQLPQFKRLPKHIGIIPDGNRRWAESHGLTKECGYENGIGPGMQLYEFCSALGIKELTFYGFTQDNTKRPHPQKKAFKQACIDAVLKLSKRDAALRVIGNVDSPSFPRELIPYTNRISFGKGSIKINFLVNYGWQWDLNHGLQGLNGKGSKRGFYKHLASSDVSRVDLIIRWGGRRRLSGFLPVQSIYSDFYIIDDYWPDFTPEHLFEALRWYEGQDVTLGG